MVKSLVDSSMKFQQEIRSRMQTLESNLSISHLHEQAREASWEDSFPTWGEPKRKRECHHVRSGKKLQQPFVLDVVQPDKNPTHLSPLPEEDHLLNL